LLPVWLAALLAPAVYAAQPPPAGPPYQIVLRSRHAEATPNRTPNAQTGGGWVAVEQPELNTIVVTMGGSAVVGSECCHGASAGIAFTLTQDLDILPTHKGVRPPRIGMVGRVVGTLQVTDPCHCGKGCGTADQGPATACLAIGGTGLLAVNVNTAAVSCGQESSINFRDGPVEHTAVAESYKLSASFRIGVTQGKGVFSRQVAVADFDPAPQLDGFWSDGLKTFRAVPRRDFGFKVVVRVVEEAAPEGVPQK
jgi:hypothetical protein